MLSRIKRLVAWVRGSIDPRELKDLLVEYILSATVAAFFRTIADVNEFIEKRMSWHLCASRILVFWTLWLICQVIGTFLLTVGTHIIGYFFHATPRTMNGGAGMIEGTLVTLALLRCIRDYRKKVRSK